MVSKMLPTDMFFVTTLQFLVYHYTKAENLAPGNFDEGEHLASRAVRIRCPAESFTISDIAKAGSQINFSQQQKTEPSTSASANEFLNHVLQINSRIYQCNSPILEAPQRVFFSRRSRRDLQLGPARTLNTELNVILDCLTTRHNLPPETGRKGVVMLESTGPQLWEFSKLVSGDDCELVSFIGQSHSQSVKEPKFKVQGSPADEADVSDEGDVTTKRGPGRRRRETETTSPATLAQDVEHPEAFKGFNSVRNKHKPAVAPVRPKLVQQANRTVQVEWRAPSKGSPVEHYRVEYLKDDSRQEWLPCHEGNLGPRIRAFQFSGLMLYRRYKFRLFAQYENGEEKYSSPTTWFKLEKWT